MKSVEAKTSQNIIHKMSYAIKAIKVNKINYIVINKLSLFQNFKNKYNRDELNKEREKNTKVSE